MKNNIFYNLLFAISITLFSLSTAFAQGNNKPDFTGTWKINVSKSDFGGAPAYSLNKALKIVQSVNQIEIDRTSEDDKGADSTAVESAIYNGKPVQIKNNSGVVKEFTFNWSADGKALTEVFSYSNVSGEPMFQGKETLERSDDGKALIITRNVSASNGFQYTVKGYYDKSN
ncbi:MAG: hypothetical protein ACTHNW_00380 [Mucilaginibacter sp.]